MTDFDETNDVIEFEEVNEENGEWCDNCQAFHPVETEPTEDEIRELLAAQGATPEQIEEILESVKKQQAFLERLQSLTEQASFTEDDAELFANPDTIIDAFEAALDGADGKDKLLGILASVIGTNIELSAAIQAIKQQMMQAQLQQLFAEQQGSNGGEVPEFIGFDDDDLDD